jgi:hypothetical protein
MPSQIVGRHGAFAVTNIRFADGSASLDAEAKGQLKRFANSLHNSSRPENSTIYVIGLAAEEKTARLQLILSAQRAYAVAAFMQDLLDAPPVPAAPRQQQRWAIFSWGVGPGGFWVDPHTTASEQPDILIGVLKRGL